MSRREAGLVVFAKPAVRGEVKTRLASAIGADRASAVAQAFIEDTWSLVRTLPWIDAVLATTNVELLEVGKLDRNSVWPQGEGDLGQRVERVMRRALRDWRSAIAVGADTPGLPLRLLEHARDALRDAHAVLGPAEDGGFYLMGLRRCPEGLLHNLPWSQADTFAKTLERLKQSGLTTTVLEPWFDVDRWEDLLRLRRLLDAGELVAPESHKVIRALWASEPMAQAT